MATAIAKTHPAKYSDSVLDALRKVLDDRKFKGTILDQFAGIGRIHELAIFGERTTFGVELEPEWAACSARTIVGDATALPYEDGAFNACIYSPPYATRMADAYAGDKKGSRRYTYRISLGRLLTAGSIAGMQWGKKYKKTMHLALEETWRVLEEGGLFILNISDHIRKGQLQGVPGWYLAECKDIGFTVARTIPVETPRLKHGKNYEKRAESEWLLVMTKPYKEIIV